MSRRAARTRALQVLFQVDFAGADWQQALGWTLEEFPLAERDIPFAHRLVVETLARQQEIDALIQRYSWQWDIGRVSTVDRNILRMAIFELCGSPDVPPAVVIDEAVELAKTFDTEEGAHFVNGILDAIYKDLSGDGKS